MSNYKEYFVYAEYDGKKGISIVLEAISGNKALTEAIKILEKQYGDKKFVIKRINRL